MHRFLSCVQGSLNEFCFLSPLCPSRPRRFLPYTSWRLRALARDKYTELTALSHHHLARDLGEGAFGAGGIDGQTAFGQELRDLVEFGFPLFHSHPGWAERAELA